jgi:hypothetical protein
MKTIIFRHLLFASVASLIAFSSRSQINTKEQIAYAPGSTGAVNMTYLKADLPSLKNYVSDEKAKRKILRYFSWAFENADNIAWGKVDDNVIAEFTIGDIKNRALFDKRGNLIYTIAYSDEKLLPQYYREMVHNLYAKYKVNQVSRVNEALREIWIVKLETWDKLLTVRIENGETEEVEKFQKPR